VNWMQKSRGRVRLTKEMKVIYSLLPDESAHPVRSAHALLASLEGLN